MRTNSSIGRRLVRLLFRMVLTTTALVINVAPVQASVGAGIGADPIVLKEVVRPGHSAVGRGVYVANTGDQRTTYELHVKAPSNMKERPIPIGWVRFGQPRFVLEPKGRRLVPLAISVPKGASSVHTAISDGFVVRDCDISQCLDGFIAFGNDAQTGVIEHNRFTTCRRGITESSFIGNYYAANYLIECPSSTDSVLGTDVLKPAGVSGTWWKDNQLQARFRPSRAYGIAVPRGLRENASVWVSNWLEGSPAYLMDGQQLVMGGGMVGDVCARNYYLDAPNQLVWFDQRAERVGGTVSALTFRGGPINRTRSDSPQDRFGEPMTILAVGMPLTDNPANPADVFQNSIALLQDTKSSRPIKKFDRASADPDDAPAWTVNTLP